MLNQHTFLLFVTLLLGPFAAAAADATCDAQIPQIPYQVVGSHAHDATAFTQGLIWRGGEFIESTGQYGASALIRWAPGGGVRARRALSARRFGEGLTLLDGELWQVTWKAGEVYVYGADDLRRRRVLHYDGDGWGLTSNGKRLIMSDGSDKLFEREPVRFEVTKITPVRAGARPVARLNELEFDGGTVWANIWMTDRIARIDYASGCVTGWLDLTGLWPAAVRPRSADVLNGIALNPANGHLFVTGKYWPRIYELSVDRAHSL